MLKKATFPTSEISEDFNFFFSTITISHCGIFDTWLIFLCYQIFHDFSGASFNLCI